MAQTLRQSAAVLARQPAVPGYDEAVPAVVRLQPVAKSERRITELDGMRGMAILMVLVYHMAAYQATKPSLLYFVMVSRQALWAGVDLFFVLSGFLIGGILFDHIDSPKYYSVFYARRIHRIFPLYYLLVAGLFVGLWLWPKAALFNGARPVPLWAYPLFLQNTVVPFTNMPMWMGVTWSLAVEEQFYLVLPFLVKAVTRERLVMICLACIVLSPLLRVLMMWQGIDAGYVGGLLPCRADSLAFGVIAATLFRDAAAKAWLERHRGLLYSGLVTSAWIAVVQLKWTSVMIRASFGFTVVALMAFCLLLVLLFAPIDALTRLFRRRWLVWLGGVSYCVYLIHEPLRYGLFEVLGYRGQPEITNLATFGLTLVSIAIIFGIAQISSIGLERPLIRSAHRRYRY